jgi:hypothetical protein
LKWIITVNTTRQGFVYDGFGGFTQVPAALPEFNFSGSCVIAADFDKDGDLDLFVGGRAVAGKYPLPQSTKILLNESKEGDKPDFLDVTDKYLPELNDFGMVTAALIKIGLTHSKSHSFTQALPVLVCGVNGDA